MQFPSSFSVSCRSTFLQSSFPILLNHSWTSSARLKLSVKVEIRSPGAGLSTPALDNKAHPIMKETLNWFTDWGTLGLSFSHRLAGARGLAWKNAEEPEFHEAAVLTGSLRVEEWMRKHSTPVPWLTQTAESSPAMARVERFKADSCIFSTRVTITSDHQRETRVRLALWSNWLKVATCIVFLVVFSLDLSVQNAQSSNIVWHPKCSILLQMFLRSLREFCTHSQHFCLCLQNFCVPPSKLTFASSQNLYSYQG